jgi:putative NADH-flavin reductase
MTSIALFGATGKTGRIVLDKALAAGYTVRALVRDPARLETRHERLTVIPGDVLDAAAVAETVTGCEVILSLFGHVKGSPAALQTDGTKNIVTAMHQVGAKRIVTLSGGGLRAEGVDQPKLPDRVIRMLLKIMARKVLADAEGHLKVLQESGLDWTVVRAPRLTGQPGSGTYRVGWVGVNTSTQISRHDLADFILTQVSDRQFITKMPFVSA